MGLWLVEPQGLPSALNEGFKDHFLHRGIMSEGDVADDEVPVIEEGMETMDIGPPNPTATAGSRPRSM